ncbi:sulfite exporter TauE/SafE family protein [Pseudarthrobacter sp. NPDC055928]|uniref:sulfite exporter TauE/SafE family protein n=1 Tax=Pseudarthrobacter sp. NPDC055928 TaxID=3345661 RepID=UPI0035E18C9F
MNYFEFGIIAAALCAAACLQGSVGFGMGMIAAPVVAVINPSLLPALVVLLAALLTLVVTIREREHLDLRGASWALVGRIPGSIFGAWLVVVLPGTALVWLVAIAVLVGLAAALNGWAPLPVKRNLIVAGAASGVLGTTTSIGGTPMAIIWQRSVGAELRGTMSAFFLVGSCMSIVALAVAGAINKEALQLSLVMLPAVAGGYVLSRYVNRILSPRRTRAVAFAASSLGLTLLVTQQLLLLL